jgi:hypothetical protein
MRTRARVVVIVDAAVFRLLLPCGALLNSPVGPCGGCPARWLPRLATFALQSTRIMTLPGFC